MSKVWMIILGLTVVVALGGTAYYFAPSGNGNPLLTADRGDFKAWVPYYFVPCGKIVFEKADPKDKDFSDCVHQIKFHVFMETHHQLQSADVLDPRVAARWREVMGKK